MHGLRASNISKLQGEGTALLSGLRRGAAAIALPAVLLSGAASATPASASTHRSSGNVEVVSTSAPTSFSLLINTDAPLNAKSQKNPDYEIMFADGAHLSKPVKVYKDTGHLSLRYTYKSAFGEKTIDTLPGLSQYRAVVYVMKGSKRGPQGEAVIQPPSSQAAPLPAPTFSANPQVSDTGAPSYSGVQPSPGQMSTTIGMGMGAFGSFSTNAVMGRTTISALSATSSDGTPDANLELNSELTINTTSGTQYYWLQSIDNFNTSSGKVQTSGWVWDLSPGQTYTFSDGTGYQGAGTANGTNQHFVHYATGWVPYSLPSSFDLINAISSVNANSVTITFANSQSQGSAVMAPAEQVYYQATITLPGTTIESAALTGNPTTEIPINGTSFIWSGQTGGTVATFSAMQSTMSLYSSASGALYVPLQATQDFGYTGESAGNLSVSVSGNSVNLGVGTLNPGTLTS